MHPSFLQPVCRLVLVASPQGQEKMSKSDPNSAIFMEDSEGDVNVKIKKAYCPPQVGGGKRGGREGRRQGCSCEHEAGTGVCLQGQGGGLRRTLAGR
jgi:tryptophanyl-tRNA synthetase